MVFSIRKVLPAEADEYVACHVACWLAAYRGIIPDSYLDAMPAEAGQRAESMRRSLLDPGDERFYCADADGRIVGRLVFGCSRDLDRPAAGEVMAIYLLPEFWGQGHGRQLMDFAVASLKAEGYREVLLWVLAENARARRFYERYGFKADGASKLIDLGRPLVEVRYLLES